MFENITIPVPDGKDLAATIHWPSKDTEKLAILCPGYLDTKDYPHLIGLAEELAEEGHVSIRFDFTGTWESKGTIEDYTVSQQLKDIENVIAYMLKERKYTHILLGGHSRGGFVSILYAARDPKISMVLGIMSPYGIIRTVNENKIGRWERDGFRISFRDIPESKEKREFKVPYWHVEDAKQYDALREIKKLHAPLILIAGEKDNVIPPEDVRLIFERANEPKRLVEMKGIGHDYRRVPEEIKEVNSAIISVMKELTITLS